MSVTNAVFWLLLQVLFAAVALLLTPLNNMMIGVRIYHHFYYNNFHHPSREVFVLEHFPFNVSSFEVQSLIDLHKQVPQWEKILRQHNWLRGITYGNNVYAPFVKELLGTKAYETLTKPRKEISKLVQDHFLNQTGKQIYPVPLESVWSAFSIASAAESQNQFDYHYDAEGVTEYRALFVVQGGDDCGEPSVHYLDESGQEKSISVPTGGGYMIRGSTTFHSVRGGGCHNTTRVMYGVQFSERPDYVPVSLCSVMLSFHARIKHMGTILSTRWNRVTSRT